MRKTFLRSDEMHDRYLAAEKDPNFYETVPSMKEWQYWRIIENQFPYDTIASVHHILIPKREFQTVDEANEDETVEIADEIFDWIKKESHYDMILENLPHQQSQPQRLHYHLLKLKTV